MKFTIPNILLFVGLVVGFYFLFGPPALVTEGSYTSQRGANRAWLYTYLLFIGGAACACFGEKKYGLFPPTSLRWLFIAAGVVVMGAAAAWMHSLQAR